MDKQEIDKSNPCLEEKNHDKIESCENTTTINNTSNKVEINNNSDANLNQVNEKERAKTNVQEKAGHIESKKDQKEENNEMEKENPSIQEELEVTLIKAQDFFNAKLFKNVIEICEDKINPPKNIDFVNICALAYYKLEEIKEAIQLIESYFKINEIGKNTKKEYEALKNLSDLYYSDRNYLCAKEKIEKCKSMLIEFNFKGDKASELEKLNFKIGRM